MLSPDHIVEGLQHQEHSASLIALVARLIRSCDHFNRTALFNGFTQLPQRRATLYQQNAVRIIFLHLLGNLLKLRARRAADLLFSNCYGTKFSCH